MSFLQALLRGFAARQRAQVEDEAKPTAAVRRQRRTLKAIEAFNPVPEPGQGLVSGEEDWASGLANPTVEAIYKAAASGAPGEDILDAFSRLSPSDQLQAIEDNLKTLPKDQVDVVFELLKHELNKPWIPLPGPQTMAFNTPAEIIGYGGSAGSGKTSVMVGLSGQQHKRSLILRREAVQLTALIDYAKDVYSRHGWNYVGSPVRRMDSPDGRTMIFGHCKEPDDWRGYAGQARDFLGLDEATEFLKSQVYALMGWVRTTVPGQRCRVLFATNPPRSADGAWFVDMFRPWIDPNVENRAMPGEVRWAIRKAGEIEFVDPTFDDKGKVQEYVVDGEPYTPQSYTFIPGRLQDNPYLLRSGYKAQLQALEEPLRSQLLYGDFLAGQQDGAWQVIPSDWVQAAMDRWTPQPPAGKAMTTLGVDIACGGSDLTSLSPRYGNWYAPLQVHKGKDTKDGPAIAALVIVAMRDNCQIVIDMGGGWGGSTFDHLKNQGFDVIGFNPSNAGTGKTQGGLEFRNMRASAWWTFREALDPVYGAGIALPPDPELKVELCMPTWKSTNGGVLIESKEDIRKRLGRSTDRADAVVMAWMFGDARQQAGRHLTRGGVPQQFAHTGYERLKKHGRQLQSYSRPRR